MKLCDVCAQPAEPLQTYRISLGAVTVRLRVCAVDSAPINGLMAVASRRRHGERKPARRRRTFNASVSTLEDIDNAKKAAGLNP